MSIEADVERAIVLRQEIKVRVDELKQIEKRLEAAALKGPHIPLEDANRQGRQYIARGTSHRLPIVLSSDELMKSFRPDSPQHARLVELVGEEKLQGFFELVTKYETRLEDGQKFRAQAVAVLGEELAPQFITACVSRDKHGIAKNKIVIALDRVEAIEP